VSQGVKKIKLWFDAVSREMTPKQNVANQSTIVDCWLFQQSTIVDCLATKITGIYIGIQQKKIRKIHVPTIYPYFLILNEGAGTMIWQGK